MGKKPIPKKLAEHRARLKAKHAALNRDTTKGVSLPREPEEEPEPEEQNPDAEES